VEKENFCSLNIAVFCLEWKKDGNVGLDLRKPKLSSEFNLTNEVGIVNYLIGQKT
jgi:hypothetical protein